MQLTRCHESQLKPDFQKPCYSIQLMDNYHIQKLGGLLTQYARDTRLYPAFRVRVWPWKTTQIRGGKYMDFVFFYGTSCVTLELITRLWMSSERNSLLYCNWCMAHDGWLLLYLVPVSSCNLFYLMRLCDWSWVCSRHIWGLLQMHITKIGTVRLPYNKRAMSDGRFQHHLL